MASDIDICNTALAHLGDTASVTSISPPEGSVQAQWCSMFYPLARDALLEMHAWRFATRRATLAEVGSDWAQWAYAYAMPANVVTLLAVIPPTATYDYSEGSGLPGSVGAYVPQAYSCEGNTDGELVIYSNQADAVLRYVTLVTDSAKFSPLFALTLSWQLASMLAGPLLKGDVGAAEEKRCAAMVQAYLARAAVSDASQRNIRPQHNVGWIAGR